MPNNTNPNYTTGLNTPAWIKLTGQGVTNANPQTGSGALVGGNNTYKVTLSLSNSISAGVSATVAVTASLFDLAGAFQSIAGSVITALSYNNAPLSDPEVLKVGPEHPVTIQICQPAQSPVSVRSQSPLPLA
jgi:hypothetical protein